MYVHSPCSQILYIFKKKKKKKKQIESKNLKNNQIKISLT